MVTTQSEDPAELVAGSLLWTVPGTVDKFPPHVQALVVVDRSACRT